MEHRAELTGTIGLLEAETARALHGTVLTPERFARVALTVIRRSPK